MRFRIAPTSTRIAATPNVSAALIGDWAERVMDLSEETRASVASETPTSQELEEACLVRDQVQNRLELPHPGSESCTERSLETLRTADVLFRQLTSESTTAAELSAHNHYPRRGEWWWKRLLRGRKR